MAHYRRVKKALARIKKIYHNELESIRRDIKDADIVELCFYPDHYDPSKNANGGSYISYERFIPISNDNDYWEKHYGTSADFAYCPVFGEFQECCSCGYWNDGCKGIYEIIKTKGLIEYVHNCLSKNKLNKNETDAHCVLEIVC